MELQGKLIATTVQESGIGKEGKPWKKQTFVIETMEQFPKKIAFEAWNDDCRQIDDLEMGNILKVAFNLQSRESSDGRWFTTAKSWKVQVIGK